MTQHLHSNKNRPWGQVRSTETESNEHDEDVLAKRVIDIPNNVQAKLAYDSNGSLQYVGSGAKDLSTSDSGWLVYLLSYDSNGNLESKTQAYGSWDNRASLTYS